jgi:hypothetical protein
MRIASMMVRIMVVALVGLGLTILPGCSLFSPKTQAVSITATDPNAEIFVDGAPVGKGTVVAQLDRRRSHTVTAKANGKAGAAAINKHISGTGVLDIVGGCLFLFPFLGVLGAGFWDLEPANVTVHVQ